MTRAITLILAVLLPLLIVALVSLPIWLFIESYRTSPQGGAYAIAGAIILGAAMISLALTASTFGPDESEEPEERETIRVRSRRGIWSKK